MLHLIPRPWHRLALRTAHRTRHVWRMLAKPRLAGVSVIARNAAGEVLLVRHSYGPASWSFPGGGCGRKEDPEAAARREMREELGCELEALELVSEIHEVISGAPHTAYVFAALVAGTVQPDGREITQARFYPVEALPAPINTVTARRLEAWLQQG